MAFSPSTGQQSKQPCSPRVLADIPRGLTWSFLLSLVIISLVMVNVIFTEFQTLKSDDQHVSRVIKETVKGMTLQNEILQFNLSRCRAKKPQLFTAITTFLRDDRKKLTRKWSVRYETRQSSLMSPQLTHRMANKVADMIGRDETPMVIHRQLFNYMARSLRDTRYPGVENYTRYAVARLGLSPLTDVHPLVPGFGPVINDVFSFRYPLTIEPCNKRNDRSANKSVFIAVVSACGNFDKRDTIRQTWKRHFRDAHDEGLLAIAGFAFLLGLSDDKATQQRIEDEGHIHADIIQIAMSDNYKNLPLKDAALFNWLHANCADTMPFVAKVDDDVYVNVRNLAHFVRSHHQHNKTIFGVGKPRAGWPDRDGKWAITYEEWPWKEYPPYMLGAIVLMAADTILPLLAACQTTPMIPLEDVYLYGMCARKADIQIRYSAKPNRALIGSIVRAPTTCELRTLIAWRPDHLSVAKVRDIMRSSHRITDHFYRNTSQCIIKSGPVNATHVMIDHTQPVHFTFIR